jgi:hypothetical protein
LARWELRAGNVASRSDRKPYAVLDVETDGLRGPLTYWTTQCECPGDHFASGTDAASLWDWVLKHESRDHANRDHVWWAHSGGEYDYVYLLNSARAAARTGEADISILQSGSRVIGFKISQGHHRTDLRDSYALLMAVGAGASLADLSASFAPHLPKLDIGLKAGVRFDPEREDHRTYARRDVESLLAVLQAFRTILADEFSGTLPSWTGASTALRAWQQTIPDGTSYRRGHAKADAIARAGYYGGLVHLGDVQGHEDVTTLDVNSMYPAAMRDGGVPVGWARPVRRFREDRPGMYVVDVDVPADQPFTFLAYREGGHLAWPTGRFPTVLTSIEILAARERGIAVNVKRGIVWEGLAYPFNDYIAKVEALRARGGAFSVVGKLLGNGLYGRFGMRPNHEEWRIQGSDPGAGWQPAAADGLDDTLDGIWTRNVTTQHPCMLPHWAAWITATARLHLLRLAEAIGAASIIYTDTDSLTAPTALVSAAVVGGRIAIGTAFGQVKVEKHWSTFAVVAPKVYSGLLDLPRPLVGPPGPHYTAKGIRAELRVAAFAGETVAWDSPNAAIQVLRGAPMLTRRERRLSSIENSVGWRAAADGTVRPVHLGS